MDLAENQASDFQNSLKELRLASVGIRTLRDVRRDSADLGRWRCGRIVTQSGRLHRIDGRWWPHCGNWLQVLWDMNFRPIDRDRCELYYHQPIGSRDFLCLSYVRSGARTSLDTFYLATLVLDEIARLKQSSAMVCNVTNPRISDRLMQRWGWQSHCQHWSGRHYIKRFYGKYPQVAPYWQNRMSSNN